MFLWELWKTVVSFEVVYMMILDYKQGYIGDWSNGKFSMCVLNLASSFVKMLVKTGRVSAFLKQMTSVLGATARKLPVISWLLVTLKLIAVVQSTFLRKMALLQFFIAGTCREGNVQIRAHTFSLWILLTFRISTRLINEIIPGYLEV